MNIEKEYKDFEVAMFKSLDAGYEEGLDIEYMFADLSDFCMREGLRIGDVTLSLMFERWRKSRRV
jgi:hypothetical protein